VSSPVDIEPPLPARLRALAGDVARLTPSRTDPERYHIAKSEIVEGLRRAAREVDWTRAKPAAVPAGAQDHPPLQSHPPRSANAIRSSPKHAARPLRTAGIAAAAWRIRLADRKARPRVACLRSFMLRIRRGRVHEHEFAA
jgi:hypothetical protein